MLLRHLFGSTLNENLAADCPAVECLWFLLYAGGFWDYTDLEFMIIFTCKKGNDIPVTGCGGP
jgi:hypothetical protein